MSESSRNKLESSVHTTDDPVIEEETDESELDDEELARVQEKAAACKFAIEQFYDGFWRYNSQRTIRYVIGIEKRKITYTH